jgi:hypothetical protein
MLRMAPGAKDLSRFHILFSLRLDGLPENQKLLLDFAMSFAPAQCRHLYGNKKRSSSEGKRLPHTSTYINIISFMNRSKSHLDLCLLSRCRRFSSLLLRLYGFLMLPVG